MGFGGIAKSQNALTDFSNRLGERGGMLAMEAANDEAGALRKQGDMAWFQGLQEAELVKREFEHFAADQAATYAGRGGVWANMGTPLAVQRETVALGEIKMNSVIEQAGLYADLYRTRADITERGGLGSFLQAQGQSAINTAQNKIQQAQQKQQMLGGLLSGGLSLGLSLLK